MIRIKLFENFQSEQDIIDICRKYDIRNYTINSDKSIDVDGDVFVSNRELSKLPLNFNHVSGHFDCSFNDLTTLQGAPKSVDGIFSCHDNKLTTLQGAAESVGGSFYCEFNKLTTLQGAPQSVGDTFDCSNNKLTTFEGAPKLVSGNFYCFVNPIYYVWELISPDDKWNYDNMDLLNDYNIFRDGNTIVKARLNSFLEDIDRPTVDEIKYYEFI